MKTCVKTVLDFLGSHNMPQPRTPADSYTKHAKRIRKWKVNI